MTDQDQALGRQKAKAPTIFDVAKQAGVSIKTVSRVVNAEINVRASTREKVARRDQRAPVPTEHGRPGAVGQALLCDWPDIRKSERIQLCPERF